MESTSPLCHGLHSATRLDAGTPKRAGAERTILKVVLGDLLFETWYGSFYPEEDVGDGKRRVDRLYVCRSCFRYSRELMPYMGHVVSHSPASYLHLDRPGFLNRDPPRPCAR